MKKNTKSTLDEIKKIENMSNKGYIWYRFKNFVKKSSIYLKRLLKLAPHIKRYDPQLGSSPAYITVPIANKGLVSYIYETESYYSKTVKQKYADKYIKALDKVNLSF